MTTTIKTGTLCDSTTNETIRAATLRETIESLTASAEGHILVDGRRCYVEGGITREQVQALRDEAATAGDEDMVATAEEALRGSEIDPAWRRCVRAIADAASEDA